MVQVLKIMTRPHRKPRGRGTAVARPTSEPNLMGLMSGEGVPGDAWCELLSLRLPRDRANP